MLKTEEIAREVEKAGHKLVSADNYKNLSSFITVQCKHGHNYVTSVEQLRKTTVCPECTKNIVKLEGYPPPKKGYRIVALDQATNIAGLAVYDNGELVYTSTRSFYGDLPQRYVDFSYFLTKEVFGEWEPDEIVFEDIQYQNNVKTFKTLGGLLGICIMLSEANKIPHMEVLNTVWQSQFYIKGANRAQQKNNAIKKVEELFGIRVSEDEADAILLGYYRVLTRTVKLF